MRKVFRIIKEIGFKNTIRVINQKIDNRFIAIFKTIYKRKPLKNFIIIESHNDFDCNGGALYNYLLKNEYDKKYRIIWLLRNKKKPKLPKNVRAYFLFKPSIVKCYHISRAKFLFADNTITPKCREDQLSVFFDHGAIALKKVTQFYAGAADKVDYIVSPSRNYDEVLCRQYDIECPNPKMLHTGYPCEDVYFHDSEYEIDKITSRRYKKVILWMPTFRVGGGINRMDSDAIMPFGIPLIETKDDLDMIQKTLVEEDILLVIKIHPAQIPDSYAELKKTTNENIVVLDAADIKQKGIDNYRLLKASDVLISDYSSTIYSFLLLDRPAAFVLSDMQNYKLGFIVDNLDDYIYGDKIFNLEDFNTFIHKCAHGVDEHSDKRKSLSNQIYEHHDGNACKRIVEFLKL